MLVSFCLLLAGIIVLAANFKRMMNSASWDLGGFGAVHLLSGFFAGIGFLGLIGGFVWFLIDKYAG
jgi:predicted cobalt transporter CbtA